MVAAHPPALAAVARPWIDGYPPGVPPTYRIPEVAVPRLLDDAARDFPEGDAVVTAAASVDYATFRRRVMVVASALADAGVTAGDRVVIVLPNHLVTPVVLFAVWDLAAVCVPVDPRLPAARLAAAVRAVSPAAVVVSRQLLGKLAAADALAETGGASPVVVEVEGSEWSDAGRWPVPLRRRPRRAVGAVATDRVRLAAVVDDATDREPPVTGRAAPADPAAIVFDPDAADPVGYVLSHANLVAAAFQARLWMPDVQAGRERVLVADRLDHAGVLTVGVLCSVLAAAALILVDQPDGADLARAIERYRPTLCVATARRLAQLTAADGRRDLTSLRVVLAHDGGLDPDTAVTLERRTVGARVRGCFGVVGAAPITHAQPVYGRVVAGSVGLPVTGTTAVVVDPDHLDVVQPSGHPGRLLVAGPQVAGQVWRPGSSVAGLVGGWLVTDEIAAMGPDGAFEHLGRRGDLLDHAGRLVPARQVEAALERHPAVRSAGAAIGVDGGLLAGVVTRRMARPDTDELLDHCRHLLDPAIVPDRVVVVPALPRTSTGALARDELSQELTRRLS